MPEFLVQELEIYAQEQEKLLSTAQGKFVLIYQDKVLGTFEAQRDAIVQGYERLGNVPFLVKQVVQVEPVQNFVSNLLGF